MSEFKIPTEIVELPSKGLLYPEGNPLAEGKVEMKYMTAKEEDILTNQAYIKQGIVLDKLLQSLIVTKINYDDLIIYDGESYVIDLSTLDNKPFDESLVTKGTNEFSYTLPNSGVDVTFKILTSADDKKIDAELAGLKKINKDLSPELSTRLKYLITSVNSNREAKAIREFVDNHLLARDSRALREYIRQVQPDVDLTFISNSGEEVAIPVNLSFFWPDA